MPTEPRCDKVYLCPHCELIYDTEYQARNCKECTLAPYYLCPTCSEPKRDLEAAQRCHPSTRIRL